MTMNHFCSGGATPDARGDADGVEIPPQRQHAVLPPRVLHPGAGGDPKLRQPDRVCQERGAKVRPLAACTGLFSLGHWPGEASRLPLNGDWV